MADRWAALEPHVGAFGPADDRPRPSVLLYHGCGGLRAHLPLYAQGAAEAGVRAFVVDSYAPRGWSPNYARAVVCTGVRFWGRERAGDVLAAVAGVAARQDVDSGRLALAGWSHGAWGVMDLMTMRLDGGPEAGLADAQGAALAGVRALFLAYPYGGFGALSQRRPWRRAYPTLAVLCGRDHLTPLPVGRKLLERSRAAGVAADVWELPDATHSFDEPMSFPPMRHRPELTATAVGRFRAFLASTLT